MVNLYLIAFFQEHIVILDNVFYDVLIFDSRGEFKTKIDAKGKGPGEFIHATDLQIRKDTILIRDKVLKKMIAFDFEGNFKFGEKEDLQSTSFYWARQSTIHFQWLLFLVSFFLPNPL